KMFKAIPTLKFVVRYGVGVDNVNLEDATKYGVQICNVPDYGTDEVADQALALMMSLTRKTYVSGNLTKAGNWNYIEAVPVHRLSTRTVGLIGVGRIGSAFARRAHVLGCRVVAYDAAYGTPGREFPDFIQFKNTMDEVLAEADILSLHCGLTKETAGMMNSAAFSKMKDGAYFLNVARGGLVDEAALEAALESGKLSGAGIDVVCSEPLKKESPIFSHPNVVVTPHMGWYSEESAVELNRKCAEETVRFLRGEGVRCPVNHV
ncbi:MAG: C-terminal binding protein, partial [Oscillibacter sp.]